MATAGSAAARTKADVVAAPTPGISVVGNQLMENGQPFVPRGVQIVGLVAPNDQLSGKYIPANAHFGAAELEQAAADHANLVRIQVSEFGLNPADPLYSASYVQEVQQGVELARSLGLNVIVSLQAESPAGNETRCPLPDAGAATDWSELASMFAGDNGIMFELYNEPAPLANPANWQTWLNGGPVANGSSTCTAVGMQSLVDEIRQEGATNVIIVPGLDYELTLAGMPTVTDPSDPSDPQLAYGIHYPALNLSTTAWDTEFGNLARTAPVIVTEWQANSTTNCIQSSPTTAPLLLEYLASKGIGVVGFAFDLPGTIISDYNTYGPTNYDDFECGVAGDGPGQVLFDDFAGEAAQQSASGLEVPRAWLVSLNSVNEMADLDPGLTAAALNTPRTFVTGASASSLATLSLGNAVPTATFTSETALAQAVASGTLHSGTQAVELALGPSSPKVQQLSPLSTFQSAALVAHTAGLLFVAAPKLGLMGTLYPKMAKQNWNVAFLRKRLAASAAKYADAVVLPFTNIEGYTSSYSYFAELATQQIKSVAHSVEVFAGMSVGDSDPQTEAKHAAEVRGTSYMVSGYNLTSSSGGGSSALALLQGIYAQSS